MQADIFGQKVLLRPMDLADLDQVMAIERICFPSPWPREAFVYELTRNHNAASWVAEMSCSEDGLQVVGSTIIWLGPKGAHIGTLAILPDCRRHGIGQSLLARALMECHKRGAAQAFLEVRAGNVPGQALYRKFGFEAIGVQKNYYTDTGEDAIIMLLSPIDAVVLANLVVHQ